MANRTWVGVSGASWNATTSWSGGAVPVAGDNAIFDSATTYTVTCTGALSVASFTVSAGTVTFTSTGTLTVSGNFSLSTGTVWNATGLITFTGTAARTITTSATSIAAPITFSGVSGVFQLQDALTVSSTQTTTLNNGTLDLNGKTLTTGFFSSNVATARTIAFGAGNITCIGAGGTLFTTATITNLTVTGTPTVNISNNSAVATTVAAGGPTEANSISFNFTTGTYTLTFANNESVRSINFTGFSGTWAARALGTFVYGGLTLSSLSMTYAASAGTLNFSSTSATPQIITSNGKTIDQPVFFNSVGGTWQLADACTVGTTRLTTLQSGTLDLNGKTLTTGFFASANTNVRTIAFGTGNITCIGAGGTLWDTSSIGNQTITGTPVVNISYAGALATRVNISNYTEANSISFNFTAGTYVLRFLDLASDAARSLNYTGFTGSSALAGLIYGNLTLSSSMTLTGTVNLSATSGTKTITTNATTVDAAIVVNGVGGTWQLQDALTMGTARTLTHTNGTIDLNGKNLTVGTAYTTAAGTKNLTFNGGTLICPTAAATAFNNVNPTGYTTTAGTGTGKISMTAATAKTFVGGGSTFNCTLSNDGAGALTITGANTFYSLGATVTSTMTLPISTTTTITTTAAITGTATATLTLTSATSGTTTTINYTGTGTPRGNYMALRDLIFTPDTATSNGSTPYTWYVGGNSTNNGNNSGAAFVTYPQVVYYISDTAVTSWTTPSDWNPSNNAIYLVGAGGGGTGGTFYTTTTNRRGGYGGGGGGYTAISNYNVGASSTISSIQVGTGGAGSAGIIGTSGTTTGGSGTATTIPNPSSGTYSAGGGAGASMVINGTNTVGAGGVGTTFNGGNGGSAAANTVASTSGGGGGGGAGGPNGNGAVAGNGTNNATNASARGGGGGGNGGGSIGSGATGGNNSQGFGGGTSAPPVAGRNGGGGGGGGGVSNPQETGASGGIGIDILKTIGGGGGAGGGGGSSTAGYGSGGSSVHGGGGGGGAIRATAGISGGSGGNGLIVITYTPSTNTGNFFFMF